MKLAMLNGDDDARTDHGRNDWSSISIPQLDQQTWSTIGITNYAQESLGDITFVEFPDTGSTFDAGETFGVVESVKAASDLYMPLSAEIIECNAVADDAPELLNSDPYGEGWLLKVKLSQDRRADDLLESTAYAELI